MLEENETAANADCELVIDALAPTVSDEVGVIESDDDKLEVVEAVIEGVGVDEPVPDTVAVTLPEAVLVTEPVPVELGVIDAEAPRLKGGVCVLETDALIVSDDDGVHDDVCVPEVVPDPLADCDDVGGAVDDPVPESEPVFDALAPVVTDAVGVRDKDRERLIVELDVVDGVPVPEFVDVIVGDPLAVMLAVILDVSEILGVTLALAPNVTEGVAEFDSDALRLDVEEGVIDGVPVLDEVPDAVLVCEGVGEGVTVADNVEDDVGIGVKDDVGVTLADAPGDRVVEGDVETVVEKLVVDEPLSLPDGV